MMRIRQFFRNGLGGGTNPGQIGDPTAYWRQLSQGLGSDPQRLAQFQGQPGTAFTAHQAGGAVDGLLPMPSPGATDGAAPDASAAASALAGIMPLEGAARVGITDVNPGGMNIPANQIRSLVAALHSGAPTQRLAAMAQARGVAKTMQHLRMLRPYGGHH